ncbi:TetR/AcrR family transcriptional regulator [Chryseobacterium sp. POL2]|uniref:TetR/AcrR family transcriptional regulator n=1 Tax=Chryseobacterium sp. POL2 TaxID=2713414 RepID=UPI0013E13700|nr:TetR/AcrR family transcriptional regulator [Chryseobacterium sp. POL2]QIG88162.1 TetR/AcrR family transcriptional regulator [Chryseobacterium sp. POL2]
MEKFTDRQIEIMEAATARIDAYGIQNLTIKTLAADIGLSEPALYRHFKSKNDILLGLLNYFITGMKNRLNNIPVNPDATAGDELRAIFKSQLQTFTDKPAIVSVIFAESIFHYDEGLSYKVSEIMELMHQYVNANIEKGQKARQYGKLINASTLTTIILGGMRMTVLKWKLSGHKSNLMKDGKAVLEGILKMIEKK